MNLKRIFGALLSLLGIGALIYVSVLFVNNSNTDRNVKALVVYGLMGLLFFGAGIGLIRSTKDEV